MPDDQSHGWYLRLKNNETIYGPYTDAEILSFAKDGRVPLDSSLKHANKTKGAWIAVFRIPSIVAVIPPTAPDPAPQPEPAPAFEQQPAADIFKNARLPRKTTPKGSVLDLFDFQFKRYATPWVVRALWVIFVLSWAFRVAVSVFYLSRSVIENSAETYLARMTFSQFVDESQAIWATGFALVLFHAVELLVGRLMFESAIAIFDISNSLKALVKLNTRTQQ